MRKQSIPGIPSLRGRPGVEATTVYNSFVKKKEKISDEGIDESFFKANPL